MWLWAREGWSARCITRAPSTSIAAETALGADLATGTVDEALLRLLLAEAAADRDLRDHGVMRHSRSVSQNTAWSSAHVHPELLVCRRLRLVTLSLDDELPHWDVSLITRRDPPLTPIARALATMLRRAAPRSAPL